MRSIRSPLPACGERSGFERTRETRVRGRLKRPLTRLAPSALATLSPLKRGEGYDRRRRGQGRHRHRRRARYRPRHFAFDGERGRACRGRRCGREHRGRGRGRRAGRERGPGNQASGRRGNCLDAQHFRAGECRQDRAGGARCVRARRHSRQQRGHLARPHLPQDERRRLGRGDRGAPERQRLFEFSRAAAASANRDRARSCT